MRWSRSSAALFLAFGALVLGALNLASRVPIAGPTPQQEMKAAFDRIGGKTAVSLGGSIGTAVDFDAMCVSGTRFFHNGQDLFETEALTRLILAEPDHPDLFFLVLSPLSLGHDNGMPVQGGSYRRRITYAFLQGEGRWGLIGGDWRQALLAQAMPATGQELRDPWHGALLRVLGRLPPPGAAIEADTRSVDPADAARLARSQAMEWDRNLADTAYYDSHASDRSRAALLRTARNIRAADAQLVIVVPPFIAPLVSQLKNEHPGRVADFARTLAVLKAGGTVVLDYWDDPAIGQNYALFRDASHLNAAGARAFSTRIASDSRPVFSERLRQCTQNMLT